MITRTDHEQIAANMDTYWKWEWFKGKNYTPSAMHAGSAAISCKYYGQLISGANCKSVLDCSCGLGRKTVLLAEDGLDVWGSDISSLAIEKAAELADQCGQEVKFVLSAWQDLSRNIPRSFDCLINDALAWVDTRRELQDAIGEYYKMLNPGGVVIFQGAHEFSDPDKRAETVAEIIASSRRSTPRESLNGKFSRDGVQMTQLTLTDWLSDAIVHTYLYVIEQDGQLMLETATLAELCRWSWEDFVAEFLAAGFREIHSHELTVEGKTRIYNMALK